MKLKNFKFIALLGLVLGASSCDDTFDINTDPNNPTSASIELVLPSGQAFTSFIVGGQYNIVGEVLAQHMGIPQGANQYRTYDQYNLPSSSFDGRQFQGMYAGSLQDFQTIIDQGTPQNEFRMVGIAKILKAHNFQILTDLYGDIPFSEALKGSANTTPKYDRQQDIYAGLQLLLDEGIADIRKQQGRFPATADFNYGASSEALMSKWIRLANTLKLKLYLRTSQKDPAGAEAGVKALYASNPDWMRNSADSFLFNNLAGTTQNSNPFYQANFRLPGNLAGSRTIGDTMVTLSDPRLPIYFLDADLATPNTVEYRFVSPGQTVYPNNFALTPGGTLNTTRYSFPGTFFIGSRFTQNNAAGSTYAGITATDAPASARPTLLLTYDESLFLRAEAATRGWASNSENAAQLYTDAVTAAIARFGVTGASVTTYLARPTINFTTTAVQADRLRKISFQKWLSLYGTNGIEAWTEVRRTNNPPLRNPIVNTIGAGNFVKRLPYPDSELTRNPSFSAVGIAPGDIQTPVWWDAD
jgi:hypothetical protein